MGRAFFIGRFQPFHKGHEYAIKYILDHEEEIVIGIGSAQENYTIKNPLTAGERAEILWFFLKKKNILDRTIICVIPDINNNFLWPRHVMTLTPRFDIVYSGNSLVLTLFESIGIKTHRIHEINRPEFSGTKIRENILNKKPWEHLIPREILPALKKMKFEERLLRLAQKNSQTS